MKKILLLSVLLTGCLVGPNYKEPQICMPEKFLEKRENEEKILSLKNWWESFNDPTLNKIISLAIDNNFDLKLAIERIEETRAYYRLQKANLFPEINLNATAIRLKTSKNTDITALKALNKFSLFQTGFDALWEVDIFGKLRREKEAAYYEYESYIESMRDVYITIIADAARYYIDICALQNIIDLTAKKIEYQKHILNLTSDKKTNGLNSKLPINDQSISLQEENENLLYYTTILKQTVYKLSTLIGQQPEKDLDISNFIKLPNASEKISIGMPSTLLRNRPDIRKAERTLAQATAKVGSAIAEYFPTFKLIADPIFLSSKVSDLITSNSFAGALGSFMNWPIITFGRIRANVDQKKSQQRQALITYENTILKALEDVEGSLVAYYNEAEILSDIKKSVFFLSDNISLNKNKYHKGLISNIEFLMQEKTLLDMKVQEKESERTLCHNLIALYKALGGQDWQK